MSADPFEPPASTGLPTLPPGILVAQAVVFALSALPGCWALFILVALRDICAPPNPAMEPLFVVFMVGGPLLAAAVGGYGLATWAPVRVRWGARLVLGAGAAGATVLALITLADVSRALAAGSNLAQVIEVTFHGLPQALLLAALGAVGLGWLPGLASGFVLRWLPRAERRP